MAVEQLGDTPTTEIETEADPFAGEELFEIPADLRDESDPEAPAAESKTDPAKAAPPDEATATQPRDEQGRFAEKPEEDVTATPTVQPTERAPAAAPTATPTEPEETVLEFSYRADNRVHTIPGSKITADGVFIPREHMAELQRRQSRGATYEGSFRQRLEAAAREVADVRSEVVVEKEQATAFLAFFADMMDRQERGEPAIETWLDDFSRNRVKLEADATLAAAKALRERRPVEPSRVDGFDEDPGQMPDMSAQEREDMTNGLTSELGSRLQRLVQTEGLRGLTASELTSIQNAMMDPDEMDRYFKVALDDIPEHGIQRGQIVAMDGAIAKTLKYQAGLILGARRQSQELKAAEDANRKRNGVGNAIPPTVATGVDGAPKPQKGVPKFKTREEMQAWYDAEDPLG